MAGEGNQLTGLSGEAVLVLKSQRKGESD